MKDKIMNDYEIKQAKRKKRLENAAILARKKATAAYEAAQAKASLIPFGQPILVGHHSEGRDRNFRESIRRGFGTAFALMDKAKYYDNQAANIGKGRISSDDPDALKKLRTKLATAVTAQERMKKTNALIRDKNRFGLAMLGYSEKQIADFHEQDCTGHTAFPLYALSNNNTLIRQVKKRIDELEKLAIRKDKELIGKGYIYKEGTQENRVMFLFDDKPSEEIRALLKSKGFMWSPTRHAWVRALNNAGIYAASVICERLNSISTQ